MACRVTLYQGEERFFGPGPLRLLALVAETGSLHRAAQTMGMAYSKAWRMTREAELHLGVRLLDRRTGGPTGGGSVLTDHGRELVGRFRALCDEAQDEVERLFEKHFRAAPFMRLVGPGTNVSQDEAGEAGKHVSSDPAGSGAAGFD